MAPTRTETWLAVIVVAVTSNISYAETGSLALQIAEAFAEAGSSPAGQ